MRIIFRHISGSRASEVDVITVGSHQELILGRAVSAAIRFDPLEDAGVGRHHARIALDPSDPLKFSLEDLSSRNGTLLNGERIACAVALRPGDIVQLGAGGPTVEVSVET